MSQCAFGEPLAFRTKHDMIIVAVFLCPVRHSGLHAISEKSYRRVAMHYAFVARRARKRAEKPGVVQALRTWVKLHHTQHGFASERRLFLPVDTMSEFLSYRQIIQTSSIQVYINEKGGTVMARPWCCFCAYSLMPRSLRVTARISSILFSPGRSTSPSRITLDCSSVFSRRPSF